MSEENLIHYAIGIDSEGHVVRATPYQRLQLDKLIDLNNKLDKQIALMEKMVELLERRTDADY